MYQKNDLIPPLHRKLKAGKETERCPKASTIRTTAPYSADIQQLMQSTLFFSKKGGENVWKTAPTLLLVHENKKEKT